MHVWKLTYVSWRISIAIHQTVTVSEKHFPSLMKNVYILFNLQCYHYNLPQMTSAAKNEEAILYIFLFKWGGEFFSRPLLTILGVTEERGTSWYESKSIMSMMSLTQKRVKLVWSADLITSLLDHHQFKLSRPSNTGMWCPQIYQKTLSLGTV